MQFIPDETYIETSLQEGLNALETGKAERLYSDGLDSNEYICFEQGKGFCYEDGCIIGSDFDCALERLYSLKWCLWHKFFIKDRKTTKENLNMSEIDNTSTQYYDTIEKKQMNRVLEGFIHHLTEPLSPFSVLECETAIRAITTLEHIRSAAANCLEIIDLHQCEPEANKYCEWIEYDYRTIAPKSHDKKNTYWQIPENMDELKYCPYCGKEIKIVDD